MNNKTQKRKLISFGDLSFKSTYPFIVSVFYVFRSYFNLKIKMRNDIWVNNPLLFTLLMFIGESLNGILYLISFFLSKTKMKKKIFLKFNGKSKLLLNKEKSNKHKQFMIYLFILTTSLAYGIYFSISNLMTSSLDKSNDLAFEMSIFNLFFIAYLSYVVLQYPIYKHQLFACALVVVGILLCIIVRLLTQEKIIYSDVVVNVMIYLMNNLLFSARQVFQKWLMEVKNQPPLRIIFIEAFFGICLSSIILTIFTALDIVYDPISVFKTIFESSVVWLFFGYIICCFLYGFFAIETKFYFSPTVMPVSYSFSIIFWKVLVVFESEKGFELMWYLIPGYFLLFLGCLIYNEILILYCCGLNQNTKTEITKRGLFDQNENLSLENQIGQIASIE